MTASYLHRHDLSYVIAYVTQALEDDDTATLPTCVAIGVSGKGTALTPRGNHPSFTEEDEDVGEGQVVSTTADGYVTVTCERHASTGVINRPAI